MSHDYDCPCNPECPDCHEEVTQNDQGMHVCACGVFPYLCDTCNRPHRAETASCSQCIENAMSKGD